MEIQNAEWRAKKNEETGEITLYRQGSNESALVSSIAEFKALAAIIERI